MVHTQRKKVKCVVSCVIWNSIPSYNIFVLMCCFFYQDTSLLSGADHYSQPWYHWFDKCNCYWRLRNCHHKFGHGPSPLHTNNGRHLPFPLCHQFLLRPYKKKKKKKKISWLFLFLSLFWIFRVCACAMRLASTTPPSLPTQNCTPTFFQLNKNKNRFVIFIHREK